MRSNKSLSAILMTVLLLLGSLMVLNSTEGGPSRDYNPHIWSGEVTPSIGDVNTTFNFTLNYRDGQNNTPTSVLVAVDGFFYNMTSENETLLNISIAEKFYYNHTGSFAPGTHEYFFYAVTANGSDRYPSLPYNRTFKVYSSSPNDPELIDPQHHPNRPTSETKINFTIKYRDLDGDAPKNVFLQIFYGTTHNHTYPMNITPGNYSIGVQCYIIGMKLDWGNLLYRFIAENIKGEIVLNPEEGEYNLDIVKDHPPILYNNTIYPPHPDQDEVINFSVNYSDFENDPPLFVVLEIYDSDMGFFKSFEMVQSQGYNYHYRCVIYGKYNIDGRSVFL